MACNKCGTNNVDTAKFCASCGNALNVNTVPVNQVTQPVQPVQHVESVVNVPVNPVVNNVINPMNVMQPATKQPIDIKRFIIVGLLFAIIIMMVIVLVVRNNRDDKNNNDPVVDDGINTRTVMIYMVGSNLESRNKIASADINGLDPDKIDFDKMNIILYTGGTEKWHNFVSNEENAIYVFTKEGFVKKESYSKLNMGDPDTLTTLLDYGYDNYKADQYDLIFWNHGGAVGGAIYDDFTNDNLSIEDMSEALDNSNFKGDNKLSSILFRTCLNGTLEVANEISDYSDYLIASEEITNGYNYGSVFTFLNEIEEDDDSIEYGKKFITTYDEYMSVIDPFYTGSAPMYAIIDLSKVDPIVQKLGEFIKGVDLSKHYGDIIRVRSSLYQYAYSMSGDGSFDMVDLYTLVDNIDDYSSVSSDELKTAIENAVVYNWSATVQESHGLSIYFPYKGSTTYQNYHLNIVDDLDYCDDYVTFIKRIASLSRSNQSSSFTKSDLTTNDSQVSKGEFSLSLTDTQASEFAEAFYIVFEKEEDGLFMPIYSSDNAYLDGNKVKTKVTNNLIKIVDHSDESSAYLQLTERSKTGVKSLKSTAVAFYFGDSEDLSEFEVEAVNLHIDYKENGSPYIAKTSIIDNGDAISEVFVDLNHYEYIQFTNYRYGILDNNGNYNPNWESSDTKYLFEVNTDSDYELVNVSLDDGDYYAIFCVTDIYGNTTYSNLVSVNK